MPCIDFVPRGSVSGRYTGALQRGVGRDRNGEPQGASKEDSLEGVAFEKPTHPAEP